MRNNRIKTVFLESRGRQAGYSVWEKVDFFFFFLLQVSLTLTWRIGRKEGGKKGEKGREEGEQGGKGKEERKKWRGGQGKKEKE